jgi:hypothetical protein
VGVHYIVASQDGAVVFDDSSCFGNVAKEILAHFGISSSCRVELFSQNSKTHPSLLIGRLDFGSRELFVAGPTHGLSPRSSSLLRQVVQHFELSLCEKLLDVEPAPYFRWRTDLASMYGAIPPTLFHGTSRVHLDSILKQGLITCGKPNWNVMITNRLSLAADAQVAAIHARDTSEKIGGRPIVVECLTPTSLEPDWDVIHTLALTVAGVSDFELTCEAGLFASAVAVPVSGIQRITEPMPGGQYVNWPVLFPA